ncbi:type II toxin-antitoxin system RelE/ParE family toxin [Mesorhizobium sophorae]|uniref:type II toxin-antitoxin system RelE/ParE family toxin n=1 Tax=Mesorhizobium sophorae TaxID=1300294 RepID=UPI001FDA6CB2|nr:type II toxin-antitoxin system RelE/ParE family toxin [Mesorhizobium sophorae]
MVDLENIGDYIAGHDPSAAVRLVDALQRRWDLLTLHPFSGAPRDDIAPAIRSSGRWRLPHSVPGRRRRDRNHPRAARQTQDRSRRPRFMIDAPVSR